MSDTDPAKVYLRRDPHDTEVAAAAHAQYRAGTDKARLLELVRRRGPSITDELSILMVPYGRPDRPNMYASRILDLVEDGWLCDSGERRLTRTGTPAIVWQLCTDGVSPRHIDEQVQGKLF